MKKDTAIDKLEIVKELTDNSSVKQVCQILIDKFMLEDKHSIGFNYEKETDTIQK